MMIQGIVILSLLVTQALCAPTGCIESCSSYINQLHTQLSGIPNHGDITQGTAQLQGLDYSRPGTWTEHNEYNMNNGKVHEEKGQIVDGHKTVRYFKKNYSSSFGTSYPSGSGISEVEQLSNNYRQGVYVPSSGDVFNSHNQGTYNQGTYNQGTYNQGTYNQVGNLESTGQQHDYNRIHSQQRTQSSIRRTNTQSERLEDFGEHSGNSEVIQQSASGLNTQASQQPSYTNTQAGNWSKVDSYKTDGGHGRVFEEEGQYTTGPKKVRYYKRNYTSSYSSSNGLSGLPVPDIANIGVDNIHRDIENIHREIGVDHIHKDIDNIHREIGVDHIHKDINNIHREIGKSYNQISTVQGLTSSNTGQTNVNSYGDLNTDSLHSVNSNAYKRRPNYRNNLSSVHHNEQQQHTSIASEYVPQQNPSQSTYGASSYRTYSRHGGHVNALPTSQYINPTSGYTNVLSTGNNGYNRNMYNEENLQQTESLQQAEHLDNHQSTITQNHMDIDNLRQNTYNQHSGVKPVAPGRISHYKEQWSSSHRHETSFPAYSTDISQTSGQNAQYNSQYRENSFNSAHQSKLGKLMVGAADLSPVGNSDDCGQEIVGHSHVQSEYRRIYKRSAKDDKSSDEQKQAQQVEQSDDLTQQAEDLTQQTQNSDITQHQFGQHSQQGSHSQESEDFTQQTGEFDDLTQQTSGKIEFGPQSPQSHQYWRPGTDNQHTEDLTQQTGDFEDLTQQTSGKLQFGQPSQQSWKPTGGRQHSEDLTQQTSDFDDLTQQTSGKLQFGQQSYDPWEPTDGHQHSEDLAQLPNDFDDPTQQMSGKLQFGQQFYEPWEPTDGHQHSKDLAQQTSDFDDLTQQTSEKLQFGQQSHKYWEPASDSQHSEDLTQQTSDFDDLTQQSSGKLHFGQHSHQPREPVNSSQQSHQPWESTGGNQHSEDLTQQTGHSEDLTQQTSGKLQFGQQTQQSYQPWRPGSTSQESEDLTQQSGGFDDLTQQTSGKLQFGQQTQQSYQPWKPGTTSPQSEDLTQQTGDFDDLTQQTSGKLQFGQQTQQSYQPWKPGTTSPHSEDFTQQTGDFDDLTQQTSGKLQFGQQIQQSHQPWKPGTTSPHSEDLTQQTGDFDDLTQQSSGKLQFGQQTQQSYQPWKPGTTSPHSEDFTQQTGDFDDLTQQTSGKLQFGQQTQQSHQPWKPGTTSPHSEDLTQQTGDFDDLTQQTSGKLQFGQQTQQSYQPWKPGTTSPHSEDLTQQTGHFDDLTQQTSGKLQFGHQTQQSHQPWRPGTTSSHSEDFTQQTGVFDDLTQQSSGKLQFGEQSYHPWGPASDSQYSEDLTQQSGDFGDFTQQTTGKVELGQQQQHLQQPWRPRYSNQYSPDMTQQNEHVLQVSDINDNTPVDQALHVPLPKPAEKPKPRPRYSKVGSVVSSSPGTNNVQDSYNTQTPHLTNEDRLLIEVLNHSADKSADRVSELPLKVVPGTEAGDTRSQDIRGDQGAGSSTNNNKPSSQKTEGLQWHYTYHPSDQRPLVQQTDKKDKGGMQQQSTTADFNDSQDNLDQQQAQNKYIFEDSYQQSSSPGKEESGLYQQSQNTQDEDQLELGQQTLGKTEDNQQHLLEPRILEAYGGGPYDALHNENIYAGVTANPSATLAPINTADSWDIREKPAETNVPVYDVTPPPLPVEPLSPDTNESTPPPSFWSRLGNKFTNTFDKAKERARSIFG